jgi:SPP1 family predicted phage head-tail adaptor
MRIGDLRHIISLQHQTKTPDGIGGFTTTWTDAATGIFAAIWPVSAKEQVQSEQMTMTVTHRIRMRYRRVLKPDWRAKYGNRYFSIVSIINQNEKNKMLELLCREVKS